MHEQAMNTLRTTASGRTFDSTYIAMMVTGHQDVLARLEGMKGTGNSASATPATAGTTSGTPSAGAAVTDAVHIQLENSIEMVRTHLQRAQEVLQSLESGA